MSIWNSLQGGRGGGRGGSTSLDDLIRNQRRATPQSQQPYQQHQNKPQQQGYNYPPADSSLTSHTPFGSSSFGRSNQVGKIQGETNLNALTPPRGTTDDIPLEYSPPSSSSAASWRGVDHISPFQSMTKPPSNPSKGSANPFFESSSGWSGADPRGAARGRGPPRGPPQKFSCRVCKLSFDSKQLLNTHLIEQQHFNTQVPEGQMFPEPNKRTFSCRVCSAVFDSNPLLYAHLKAEGHFNAPANGGVVGPAGDDSANIVAEYPPDPQPRPAFQRAQPEPVREPRKMPPKIIEEKTESKPVRMEPQSFQPKGQSPLPPPGQPSAPPAAPTRPSFHPPVQKIPELETPAPAPGVSKVFSKGPKVADLSGKKKTDEDESAPVFRSSKFPPKDAPAPVPSVVEPQRREARTAPLEQEDEGEGDDLHSDGQVVGTCTDMCPEEEILIRLRSNEIHLFEQPGEEMAGMKSDRLVEVLKATMVKQYQRSAADHKLAIPHLVRTPWTLYETMCYLEQNVMSLDHDLYDESEETASIPEADRSPNALDVYVFLWNRFRMIAKDFILQNYRYGGRLDEYCIECHERMTRWHIMCHHQLQWSEDYLISHSYTNSEQLNKLMKTLNELYDEAHLRQDQRSDQQANDLEEDEKPLVAIPNEGEIRSYYVLYQLDNGGEVEKYLQKLRPEALNHPSMQFAIKVVRARRSGNYAAFFRLLRSGNYLQACAMFKYVGFMRLEGLKVMNRVLCAGKSEAQIPLSDLTRMLLFEDDDEAEEFVAHCGLEVTISPGDWDEQAKSVVLNGKNLMDQLPRKKNSKGQLSSDPDLPAERLMYYHIEGKVSEFSRAEVCQGYVSNAVVFEEAEQDVEAAGVLQLDEETDTVLTEDDTSVESEVKKSSLPPPMTPTLTRHSSSTRSEPPVLKRGVSAQTHHPESPRHSTSVAESILSMKKSGKTLTSAPRDPSPPLPAPTPAPRHVSPIPANPSQSQPSPFALPEREERNPSPQPAPVFRRSDPIPSQHSPVMSSQPEPSQFISFQRAKPPVPTQAALLKATTPISGLQFTVPPVAPSPPPAPSPPQKKEEARLQEEVASAKAMEAERLKKRQMEEENLRKQQIRREEELQARRLQAIGQLGSNLVSLVTQRLLHNSFKSWVKGRERATKMRRKQLLSLRFMIWRRNYVRALEQRENLNVSLLAIVEGSFQDPSRDSFTRNIRVTVHDGQSSAVLPMRSDRSVVSLQSAMETLLRSFPVRCLQQRLCDAVAPTLFRLQTNSLRQQLGIRDIFTATSDLSGSSPVWNRSLFMSIALISSSPPGLSWDFSSGFLPNFIRGLFVDHDLTSTTPGESSILTTCTHNAVCHQRSTRKVVRRCHLVVTDNLPIEELSLPHSGLIILPKEIDLRSFELLLQRASTLVESNIPLVILLTKEHSSDASSCWRELSSPAEDLHLEFFLQSLADLCQREVSLLKAFLLEAAVFPQYLAMLRGSPGSPLPITVSASLPSTASALTSCFLECAEALASYIQPLPAISRVDACQWFEEKMTDALWSSNCCADSFSGHPDSAESLLVNLLDGVDSALSQCEHRILMDAKHQQSLCFPFHLFQNPITRVIPDALYTNMNDSLVTRACDLPADWTSFSTNPVALSLLEQHRLPEWRLEGDLVSQWQAFCESLHQAGWTLPRNSAQVIEGVARSIEALALAEGADSSGKRRRQSDGGEGREVLKLRALEKFIIPFRRWLTLAIQSRSETLSSEDSGVVYQLCAGEEPHLTTAVSPSRFRGSSLSQWKSNQVRRIAADQPLPPAPPLLMRSEESEREESFWKKVRNEGPSPAVDPQAQQLLLSVSRSVQSEAERYQLLEKRLLEEVGMSSEFGGNPKQRRKLLELEDQPPLLFESGGISDRSRRASRLSGAGAVGEFLKECEEERSAFEEYLREAAAV